MSLLLIHASNLMEPNIRSYITNRKVSKFLTWKHYTDETEIQKYLKYAYSCTKFPDEILCIISNDKFIGTVHILYRKDGTTQFGFGMLPEFWNQGLGTQTAKSILGYINSSEWYLHTRNIITVIHKDNNNAIKIALSLGFHLVQKETKPSFNKYMLQK